MSCVRTPGCPLFPYLNASLAGWRSAYCDSETGWRECERFKRASAGRTVPLALLPNGKVPATLLRVSPPGEDSGVAETVSTPLGYRRPAQSSRGGVPSSALAYPHPERWWRVAVRWLRRRI